MEREELREEIRELNEALHHKEIEHQSLQEELDSASSEVTDLTIAKEDLEKKIVSLCFEQGSATKRIDELLADNSRLVEEARAARRETEAAKLQVSMMSVGMAYTLNALTETLIEMASLGKIPQEAAVALVEDIAKVMSFSPTEL